MQPFDFQPSTRVVFGENALNQLGSLTKELGGRRVLIVTDPGIVKAGIVESALNALKRESVEAFVFDNVEENPTTRHVEAGVRFAKAQGQIDLIIGLGGGSAMDCAKGVNFILTNGGTMEDYWGVDKATKPMLPSIGIPTTAGTGSEAQSFALIAQEDTHRKMACGDKKARFRTVILDPTLTESVPKPVVAATGIDAVSHALESYVTTRRNPISQMLAREAWRLLDRSFEIVLRDPENIEARSQMLLGAHLAGAAVENSMLGAAHACANPLTARYRMTHGIAVGLMLPYVIRFNSQSVNELYQDLHPSPLHERIIQLQTAAALPDRLRHFQIDQTDLPQLAKEAAAQWTGDFNPRPVSETECLQLYEAAY
ncbi:MAG: iron-containing alcohol dehydrogenase [Candidatus Poribacteria bacterium]|nr:iron-containing alcohol dehydrogenase [Candidatus Poribacteria bacterium]